jgi:hypothetical protein
LAFSVIDTGEDSITGLIRPLHVAGLTVSSIKHLGLADVPESPGRA